MSTETVQREIIAAFPIDMLFFIITAGLFVVLSFPYTSVSLTSFHPFVYLNYLFTDNFPIVAAEILLFSVPTGIVFYLLYDGFEWLNHLPKDSVDYVRKRLKGKKATVYYSIIRKAFLLLKMRKKEDEGNLSEELIGKEATFYYWITHTGPNKYLDFINSMREASTALLYGCETLLAITIITGPFGVVFFQVDLFYFLTWVARAIGFFVFSVIVYKVYNIRYRRSYRSILNLFKKYQALDKETDWAHYVYLNESLSWSWQKTSVDS